MLCVCRLAKSTLTLIPLLGIHEVVFAVMSEEQTEGVLRNINLFFELFFNSFQVIWWDSKVIRLYGGVFGYACGVSECACSFSLWCFLGIVCVRWGKMEVITLLLIPLTLSSHRVYWLPSCTASSIRRWVRKWSVLSTKPRAKWVHLNIRSKHLILRHVRLCLFLWEASAFCDLLGMSPCHCGLAHTEKLTTYVNGEMGCQWGVQPCVESRSV